MLACGCDGGLYLRQETFITGFPVRILVLVYQGPFVHIWTCFLITHIFTCLQNQGSMYAPGYLLLENNRPYIEREDELDRLPPVRVRPCISLYCASHLRVSKIHAIRNCFNRIPSSPQHDRRARWRRWPRRRS